MAGLNGGITSLYGQQLSIQANGGGGGGSNDAPGKLFMSLRLYTSMLPCHLTQVYSAIVFSATRILDGKNGGSGGGAGTNSSAALGGQSELLGDGLGSSGGTASSAGA